MQNTKIDEIESAELYRDSMLEIELLEPPTMYLTCFDGTRLEIPDDNAAIHQLGATWHEIYVDSSKLAKDCRKYIVYRPPLLKRVIFWVKRTWRSIVDG